MVLTPTNLVFHLVDRGLADLASVINGELTIVELSRRNRAFQVRREGRPGFLFKQAKKWDRRYRMTLEREAHFYWLLMHDSDLAPLARFIPKCYSFDPDQGLLILELLAEGETLASYHRRIGGCPVDLASLLGETLGDCQALFGPALREKLDANFPSEIPWVLSLPEQDEKSLDSLSDGNVELLHILRKNPLFGRAVRALREEWSRDTLIHGDMKWDHCILSGGNGSGHPPTLHFVDWEFADFGDACWDAGAVLQAYLVFWMQSLPLTPGLPEQDPLDRVQLACRSFWEAYVRRVQVANAEEMLERSMAYAGARMIQTAYESLQESSQMTAAAARLLQVSLNILAAPQDAVGRLLGL